MCYIIVLELASCIPYALGHPRTIGVHEMSLEKMVSEGCLKMIIIGG